MKKTKQLICGGLGLIALSLFSCKADSGAATSDEGAATEASATAASDASHTVSLKVTGMT